MKQEIIQAEISCPYEFLESDVKSSQKCIQSEILSSHGFVQHDVPSSQGFVQREALPKQQLNESEHHSPHELVEHKVESPRECVQHEVLPLTEVDNIASTSDNCVRRNSASTECGKYFNISITINDTASDVTTDKKNSITIPKSWGVAEHTEGGGQRVVFTNIVKTRENSTAGPIIDKCVEIKTDKTLCYSVYGRVIDPEGCQLTPVLTDTALLPKTLERFKNLNVCNGLGAVNVHHLSVDSVFQDWIRRWRDKNCTMISKRKRCEYCKKMRQRILRREARSTKTETLHRIRHVSNPIDKRKLIALRKKNSRARRVKNYSKRRIRLLTQSLTKKADEIASIRAEVLAEKFLQFQVPASQQTAVKQIISAATKRHTKSRRYSEEWIMLCMLMNIRSPGFYEFLRKNDILPLPCTKTIRSYFSLIQSKCGFDEQFGQLLKKHFDTKAPHQRHGILLLDEINLRKSVAVCSRNLTYVGLTDFGEDGPESTDIRDQATHGLVLMFQPLADTYTQPIAVFASKNPVKGEELTKLVVKAIIYLERSGAKIHGVIADGAATNAKMWSMLGVSGAMGNTKTWFTHPVDEERKVFVFSDAPHVIKNIRNRLYNKRKLRVSSTAA